MVTPRVTIDQLPEQAAPEDTNYVIIQDAGVTKKVSIANILATVTTPALTNHINAVTDAHNATAVSATPSGSGVDGPDVQAQLGQIAALIDQLNTALAALPDTYVDVAGDTMTGPLIVFGGLTANGDVELGNLGSGTVLQNATQVGIGGTLTLSSDPDAAMEAATKQYADTKVSKAGDTMTGNLGVIGEISASTNIFATGQVASMSSAPVLSRDLTRKDYVDGLIAALDARVTALESA